MEGDESAAGADAGDADGCQRHAAAIDFEVQLGVYRCFWSFFDGFRWVLDGFGLDLGAT